MLVLDHIKTVADLVLEYPEEKSQQTVLTFLNSKGVETESFTFRRLKESCLRAAGNLHRKSNRQIPILLAVEDQADFVIGFFGCILAGFIPVPMAPLLNRKEDQGFGRMSEILKKGHIRSLIVSGDQAGWLKPALDNKWENLSILTIESLRAENEFDPDLPVIDPEDIAYLQYTSGSTSSPKGVILKHKSVIANMAMMYRVFNRGESVRVAGWIPLHHDMGLVGHLFTVLYESGFGVFMPPSAFLARPALWLQAIHDYRANSSATPTFAFEHCVRKVEIDRTWDLSCWHNAYVGSETVSLPILESFLKKFGDNGFKRNYFRPVYGLAEATLLAAGGSQGLEKLDPFIYDKPIGDKRYRRLIPYTLEKECNIIIKDPVADTPLKDGTEGKIWIRGQGLCGGYFAESDNLGKNGKEIPTGDIGFIKDGCLFISGREKDVVIVRGVNYTAEDLEFAARNGVDMIHNNDLTACISYLDETREHFWVFQEAHRHMSAGELEKIYQSIRANLIDTFGIEPDRVIFLPTGFMPKTPNYKIARGACRDRYLTGNLKVMQNFPDIFPAVDGASKNKAKTKEADPVVVVGMACRFPNGVADPQKFWELLANGIDAITEVPADRWDNSLFFDEKPSVPGKVNTKWAGFLENISHFDPALFGISPHEAPEIDPQQRLLLETSWRLIEQLGYKKKQLAGSSTGVYIGISTNDYLYIKIKLTTGMDSFNAYSGLGNANSIAANRLSYFYDLKGPSIAIDTACSSSLTAFHLGAQAILNGECDQAIVGGVNAILSPGPTITLSQFGMMSPEGRCKTFDASADGYVRSEGCGLVMMKRRSAALENGDRILAVLDGSVIAQDGASTGITFPNAMAQDRLIRKTLEEAGLHGAEITCVEAHGTGTSAGDPVEMEKLRKYYGESPDGTCYVGSVKANIGHLEAAAGIASVIKAILMLQNKKIPPQIHLKNLNPRIHIENTRLAIASELTDWKTDGKRRRIAISSFGFGGSLAHAILAEPQSEELPVPNSQKDLSGAYPQVAVISAHTPQALTAQVKKINNWLETTPDISFRDICYGLALGRSDLAYRASFITSSRYGLRKKLESWSSQNRISPAAAEKANICFLFTGQGEHYLHMGRELYSRFPAFKIAFDRCAAAIDGPEHPFKLKELAFSIKDTRLWADQYMQPILFAVQYALATLYQECGIYPGFLLGHSLGEYAAACIAGCMEPEDGMRILYRRGELVRSLPEVGFMATIFTAPEEVRQEMDISKVQFAAINSPKKTVISGDPVEVDRLMKHFEARGVETYFLKTDQAFHSHMLDPILEDFRKAMSAFSFSPPTKKWISALKGEVMTEAPDADYWTDHMRNTVQFGAATEHLKQEKSIHFIEIGPGATTLVAVRENLGASDSLLLRSLNIKKGERTESYFFLDTIGKLFEQGFSIRWDALLSGNFLPHLLPGQQFMHEPYWIKGITAQDFSAFASSANHPKPKVRSQSDWHYTMEWIAKGELPGPPVKDAETRVFNWLVVGPASPLIDALLVELKARNEKAFWVGVKNSDHKTKAKRAAHLRPQAGKADCYAVLDNIISLQSRAGVRDWKMLVVNETAAPPQWTTESLETAQEKTLGLLISLLQSTRKLALVFPVWVISQNAQWIPETDKNTFNPGASPLWGFCKTLFLEHPELRGGMIDLSVSDTALDKADNVIRKVLQPQFESCVAIRKNRQYIQQLVPAPLPAGRVKDFRSDGVYIITGGLGGLGLNCAKWVLSKGGKKIMLLSRRRIPDQEKWSSIKTGHPQFDLLQKLLTLKKAGAELEIISLDVRGKSALTNLFARLDKEKIPVRGILHAAGVNWFGKVMTLESAEFFDTLKIKISASWDLHRHSLKRDLECFILFSSVSALWGSAELSHYTAANQFMDMLSLYRASLGLPTLCIDWGPWAEVGMSSNSSDKAVLEKFGFALMPPESALTAMETALQAGRPLSLIADMDWDRFQAFIDFSAQPSLFAQVSTRQEKPALLETGNLDGILSGSPVEARKLIEEIVRSELRSVTLIESSDKIDPEQRFNFMGMDSLMAVSFAVSLENYFQVKLPNTLTYNYPTIRAVTDFLFDLVYTPNAAVIEKEVKPDTIENFDRPVTPEPEFWLRPISDNGGSGKKRLFCFPYAGSGVSVFGPLAKQLGAEVEMIGIQIPGREEHSEVAPYRRMDELIEALMTVFPEQESEYYIFGHSLGAVIAYEFVLALQKNGRKLPAVLLVSGCDAPLQASHSNIHQLDAEEFVEKVISRFESSKNLVKRQKVIQENLDLLRADIELLETYQPVQQCVQIPLSVICGRHDPLTEVKKMKEWVHLCEAAFSIFFIDGGHQLVTEHEKELGRIFKEQMRISFDTETENASNYFVDYV
jgi:acyl transferase domain-containing protein/acyl-CoA synthetase (AMP-forming)/AMP-acid ligase II/surfactin synthase thioesterase subunit/acyl carrier protein